MFHWPLQLVTTNVPPPFAQTDDRLKLFAKASRLAPLPRSMVEFAESVSVPSDSDNPPVWNVPPPSVIGAPSWSRPPAAPLRRSVPPLVIVMPLVPASAPVAPSSSVPPPASVAPVKSLLPLSFNVLPPAFVRPRAPRTLPVNSVLVAPLTVSVRLAPVLVTCPLPASAPTVWLKPLRL